MMTRLLRLSLFLFVLIGSLMFSDAAVAQTLEQQVQASLGAPNPQIELPGLEFTEATVDADGNSRVATLPFIGEYIAAVYQYGISVGIIIAIIMIIVAGLQWASSAGNDSVISSAKNRILKAILGIVLLAGSYTILFTLNPELVRFEALRVEVIPEIDLDNLSYEGSTDSFESASSHPGAKNINDPVYDDMFRAFANCGNYNWKVLKGIAFIESRLNPDAYHPRTHFVGLFQAKDWSCRSAVRRYPEWKAYCESHLTNEYVSTAVGSQMARHALDKIKKCKNLSQDDQLIMLYVNHNLGPGTLAGIINDYNGCDGGTAIRDGASKYWETKKNKQPEFGVSRYNIAVKTKDRIKSLFRTGESLFDTSDNGNAACPLDSPPEQFGIQQIAAGNISCPAGFIGKNVLIVGASNTNFRASYARIIKSACGGQSNITINAVNGKGSDAMVGTVKNFDLTKYDVLVTWAGFNSPSTATRDTRNIFAHAKDKNPGIKTVAINLSPWKNYGNWKIMTRNNQNPLRDVVQPHNAWIMGGGQVDGRRLIDYPIDAYRLLHDPNDPESLRAEYKRDDIHVNEVGQRVLANEIVRVVR